MKFIHSFVIFCIIINTRNCEKLPEDIKLCQYEDAGCIVKTSNSFLKKLANGRTDLNIPPIDPFLIKNVELNLAGGNAIDLKIKFNDVNIYGYSTLVFDKAVGFSRDPKTSKFEMYGKVPKLEFTGNYKANGRVLVLPFKGDGKFKMILKDSKGSLKFHPSVYKKNGLTYLRLDKLRFFLEPSSVQMNFENLFNGNEELGKTMNTLMNENWKDLWQEFSPAMFTIAENILREITRGLYERFNYEGLYLD